MNKLQNSKSIKDIDFTEFDIIFISGGWGAAYDLGYSQLLGIKISEAYYSCLLYTSPSPRDPE